MSKAERYIELVSDENGYLCDKHALKAVEIARKETLLEVATWINDTFIFSKQAKEDFSQTFNIKLL